MALFEPSLHLCWFVGYAVLVGELSGSIPREASEPYPFYVLVPKEGEQTCGGVVVGRDIVATAASCLYYEKKQRWAFISEVYVLHGNFSVARDWKAR